MTHSPAALVRRLRGALDLVVREMVKFGAVGAIAFVVDLGTFNLLRFGLGDGGPLEHKPLTAKVISATLATLVAWLGNRLWTFRHRRRASAGHELLLFVGFNVAGMAIALGCLAFSHYVLDLRSARADNLSANGVGLVLGTLFRFWAYRTFVFSKELQGDPDLDPAVRHPHDVHGPADEVRTPVTGSPAAPPR
ncbi:GtrA family protein [Angustibacter aerolatus]